MWWTCTDKDFLRTVENVGCTGYVLIVMTDTVTIYEDGEFVRMIKNAVGEVTAIHVRATKKPRFAEWEEYDAPRELEDKFKKTLNVSPHGWYL
jgi:hypothetical protein